jgi:hypothetical protein
LTAPHYRKALIAVATFVVTAIAFALDGNLIPAEAVRYVVPVVQLAGAYGVYRVPNRQVEEPEPYEPEHAV